MPAQAAPPTQGGPLRVPITRAARAGSAISRDCSAIAPPRETSSA
jgi:hypothetical protein